MSDSLFHTDIEALSAEAFLRERRNVFTLGKLVSGEIVPPAPLFEGLLLENTVVMLSAEPYSAKTLTMLSMAISLASGKALFGRHNPRGLRRTLFVGQDAPTWDYANQAIKLSRGYGLSPESLVDADVDFILNEGVSITDTAFLDWLDQWHTTRGFDVIMLDTLLEMHNADENSNREMSQVMRILKAIRNKFNATVIFSHHTTKPQGPDSGTSANYRARGASVVAGTVDFHFQLRRTNKQVNLLMPKGRGADGLEPPTYFDIMEGEEDGKRWVRLDAGGEDVRTTKLMHQLAAPSKRSDLIKVVLVHEPGLGRERAEAWVDHQLAAMRDEGRVVRVGHGTYKLTEAEVAI